MRHLCKPIITIVVTARTTALAFGQSTGVNLSPFDFQTVALFGQQAAGLPSASSYFYFLETDINSGGVVSFQSTVIGSSGTHGLFRDLPSHTQELIAIGGTTAPGMPGGYLFPTILPFGSHTINDDGYAAFMAAPQLGGFGTSLLAVYLETADGLSPLAQSNAIAESLASEYTYANFRGLHMSNGGTVTFHTTLREIATGNTQRDAIYSGQDHDAPKLLAVEGAQIPGLETGVVYGRLGSTPKANDFGDVLFLSEYVDAEGSSSFALFSTSDGQSVVTHASTGQQIAGLPAGIELQSISNTAAYNNAGATAFYGNYGPTPSDTNSAIFTTAAGSLKLVAENDGQAAGMPEGVEYSFADANITFNNSGEMAFFTRLSGVPGNVRSSSLFRTDTLGNPALVVLEGDAVPNRGSTDILGTSFSEGFEINERGTLAFHCGVVIDGLTGSGIFASTRSGDLITIIATGDEIDVSEDPFITDLRTVSTIQSTFGLNDNDTISFSVEFTNGTFGVFTTVVPASGSCLSLLFGTSWLTHRRRRE